jgi:hypothetical protein
MRSTAIVVLVVAWVGSAAAMTDVYRVDPVQSSWSDMADPEEGVSQVITLNVDTLRQVDVFIGFNEGGEDYNVNVYSHPDGLVALAYGDQEAPAAGYRWLDIDLTVDYPDSFVKGRRYRIEVTRGSYDSINYLWQEGQAVYPWGYMTVGTDSTVPVKQLACRVTGVMDTIPKTKFGAYPYFPMGGEAQGCSAHVWKAKALDAGLHQARFRVN